MATSPSSHVPTHGSHGDQRGVGAWLKGAYRWALDFYACLDKSRVFGLAAETAFWLFLSMIPLAAVCGLVAARVSADNWQNVTPLLGSLPYQTRELVQKELLTVSRWNGGTVGLTGALGFAWAASSGLHAMFEALEIEAGEERSWLRKRLMALGTCVALSCAVAFLALMGPGLDAAVHFIGARLPAFEVLSAAVSSQGKALRVVLSLAIAFGSTCLLYRFGVPPKARRSVPVVPGALVAVGSQALLSFGYTFYMTNVGGNGEAAYGASLAIVALAMTALYLFSLSILAGAVVNRRIGLPSASCPPKAG